MTYAYECRECGFCFEAEQSMTEAPLTRCPCEKDKEVRRVISGGLGVIFARDSAKVRSMPPSSCCGGGSCGHR
jgi:putative FmdB family regulatory protein